ncbi:uncharacterized protein [Cherax quadricarinatus]|uniref:uncharacterized protein isoform X6 n=1 Tax=Cherax quadricarinatus TaxID=27406 RepID=UPI00387ED09F
MNVLTNKSVWMCARTLFLVWVLVTEVKGQVGSPGRLQAALQSSDMFPSPAGTYTTNPSSSKLREKTLKQITKKVLLYTTEASPISHKNSKVNAKINVPYVMSARLEEQHHDTLHTDTAGRSEGEHYSHQFSGKPVVSSNPLRSMSVDRHKLPQEKKITYSGLVDLLRIPVATLPPLHGMGTVAQVSTRKRQMEPSTALRLTSPFKLLLQNQPSSPIPPSISPRSSSTSPQPSAATDAPVIQVLLLQHTQKSTKRCKRGMVNEANLQHQYLKFKQPRRNFYLKRQARGQTYGTGRDNNNGGNRMEARKNLVPHHAQRHPQHLSSMVGNTHGVWAALGTTPSAQIAAPHFTPITDRSDPTSTSTDRSSTNNSNISQVIRAGNLPEGLINDNSRLTTHRNGHSSKIRDKGDKQEKNSYNVNRPSAIQASTDLNDNLSTTTDPGNLDEIENGEDILSPTQDVDNLFPRFANSDDYQDATTDREGLLDKIMDGNEFPNTATNREGFSGIATDEENFSGIATSREDEEDYPRIEKDGEVFPGIAMDADNFSVMSPDEYDLSSTATDKDNYTGTSIYQVESPLLVVKDREAESTRFPTGWGESDVLGIKRIDHEHTIKVEAGDRAYEICRKFKALFDSLDTNYTSSNFTGENGDLLSPEYMQQWITLRQEYAQVRLREVDTYDGSDLRETIELVDSDAVSRSSDAISLDNNAVSLEMATASANEFPPASTDWPASGELQRPITASVSSPVSSDLQLWLQDESGNIVDGQLSPSFQYSVMVVAPLSTFLMLSVEGEGSVGVGRLLPDPAQTAHVCQSPEAVILATSPLRAVWRLQPGDHPHKVIFRVWYLGERTAGERTFTRYLITDSVETSEGVVGVRAGSEEEEAVGEQVESSEAEATSWACGWGWVGQDERCFQLVEEKARWLEAERRCVGGGGHLAAVTSPQVASLLSIITAQSSGSSPSAAYWVGATDALYENSFTWTSGAPFSYSEWFPGWSDQGGYNSQPSDDGLSNEDCVELRRSFRLATKGSRATHNLYWNDRSCLASNYFICEKPAPGAEPEKERWSCNRSLTLSPHAPPTIVTSPGFPAHYPPTRTCHTILTAPPTAHVVIQFDAFVLESHPTCEYDWVTVSEVGTSTPTERLCGDWSTKLKLLRYVSSGNRVVLTFVSDYAHDFPGFRARVSARTGSGCGDGREVRHGDVCYLLVSYPQVTWTTATHICSDMEGSLASVSSRNVLRWLGSGLLSLSDYAAGTLYWLGGTLHPYTHTWTWQDGTILNTTEVGPVEGRQAAGGLEAESMCLSLQELSPAPPIPHKPRPHRHPLLSLSAHQCDLFGGYICARKVPDPPARQSSIVLGYGGNLTTPGYPSPYPNNLHLTLTLRGPPNSRLIVSFVKLDLEYQLQCLYDYVGLQNSPEDAMVRYCGRHASSMNKFDFVSDANEAVVTFHSDWSVVGTGVLGRWRVVDTSTCPHHQLTEPEGVVTSPNFPDFYLANLHCTTLITAPEGQRVWLQFKVFEVGGEKRSNGWSGTHGSQHGAAYFQRQAPGHASPVSSAIAVSTAATATIAATTAIAAAITATTTSTADQDHTKHKCQKDYVEVILGKDAGESIRLCGTVSSGEVERLSYVSYGSSLTLVLHTSYHGHGRGFQASYSMGASFKQQAVVHVDSSRNKVVGMSREEGAVVGIGRIHALNFPLAPAPGVTLVQQLLAPPGHQLHLRLHHVAVLASPSRPCLQDYVEIEDWYAGRSGTVWKICKIDRSSHNEISIRSTFNTLSIREVHLGPQSSSYSETTTTTKPPSLRQPSISNMSSPFGSLSVASHRLLSSSILSSLGSLSSETSPEASKSVQSSETSSEHLMSRSINQFPTTISHNAVFYTFNDDNSSSPSVLSSPLPPSSSPEHKISSSVYPSPSSLEPERTDASPSSSPSSKPTSSISKTNWVSSVAFFSATYEVHADPGWLNRSMGVGVGSVGVRVSGVASCDPSPCLNSGRCITEGTNHSCLCTSGYTGAFCQVMWCEMSPCLWGQCHSGGSNGYICVCERGYGGPHCKDRVSPCDGDPCQSRGVCTPGNHTFKCQCHAWWEGERCEHRMLRIPFKPLSERMFEEPFWLGLMTVAIVMGCIGIIFCIKKHFAEKIEKFFAEEIERSKYGTGGSVAATSSGSPRRSSHKCRSQTASPRADSKKILRHLVTPPVGHRAASFDEFLHLRTQIPKCSVVSEEYNHLQNVDNRTSSSVVVERTRSADIATELLRSDVGDECIPEGLIRETSLISLAPSPSKQDKRVTFAKLLDKMSKEMSSSSSDMSCNEEKSPSRIFNFGGARRSPRRSPRIRHTQRYSGSGSEDVMETPDVSSSEMTPDPPKRLLTVKSSSSPSSKTSSPQSRTKMVKISSADSLLAMIKNFGGSGRPSSNPSSPHGSEFDDSSTHASPSTTPTTPQKTPPQCKQDTLTVPGTLQVQVQSAGGSTQNSGPVITLEVPNNDQHRCLSPITELPTPVPTPVPSPLPTPCRYRPKPRTSSESNDNKDSEDTESEFSLSISVERSSSDSSGPDHRIFFTSLKSLHSLANASARSETLSPTGATVTPSSSLSSRTPSPVTSPNISPATSPKVKTKPPPLHIPNANLLHFSPEKGESSSDGACGGITIPVPMIKVEDTDNVQWDSAPRTRSQSVDVGRILQAPIITISSADDDPQSPPLPQPLIIPTLNVTLASPPALRKQYPPVPTISIEAPQPSKPPVPPPRRYPLQREKAGSLDLQPTPTITVTNMLSEVESDTDSPTSGCRRDGPSSCYLSPFLGVDLRASESNLSSSGYSSAYSPGPSRCSSNNPLCPEEPTTPSVSSIPSRPLQIPSPPPAITPPNRSKRRPLLKSPPTEIAPISTPSPLLQTDSETTDDPAASQPEADSALELDTNDECSDGVMQRNEVQKTGCMDEGEAQRQRLLLSTSHSFPKESPRLTRSPPAIVVHGSLHSESSLEDCLNEKPARLSPVSSRSESPISDSRLSVARIYPAFFGVSGKPELPYTDSDGLYDCPSSEVLHSDSHATTSPLKRLGRKRLKRSPGKGLKSLLGIGNVRPTEGITGGGVTGQNEGVKSRLEPPHWDRSPRRHSPKRRVRAQTSVDLLSSSNDSITSQSPVGSSSSPGENEEAPSHEDERLRDGSSVGGRGGRRRRPLLRGESIPSKYLTRQGSVDASGEETQEEQLMLKPSRGIEELPRHRKVSRFRNFGNQIRAAEVWVSHCRFLRRLQLSRGGKDHLVSPAGSSDSDPECGPPMGPSCTGPSNKSTSSSSSKGSRSPSSQIKYMPVSGGCVTQSLSP